MASSLVLKALDGSQGTLGVRVVSKLTGGDVQVPQTLNAGQEVTVHLNEGSALKVEEMSTPEEAARKQDNFLRTGRFEG